MNAPRARSGGVAGRSEALPDQGAGLSSETVRQSCPTADRGSTQLRIRLPAAHAARWLALTPKLREHVAGIAFGSVLEGVELAELIAVASELREARLAISNALQLALVRGATLDTRRVGAALDRINSLLGGMP